MSVKLFTANGTEYRAPNGTLFSCELTPIGDLAVDIFKGKMVPDCRVATVTNVEAVFLDGELVLVSPQQGGSPL